MTRITGSLHEGVCTLTIISRSILRMKNVSDYSYRQDQNTHFMFILCLSFRAS